MSPTIAAMSKATSDGKSDSFNRERTATRASDEGGSATLFVSGGRAGEVVVTRLSRRLS
jgi:hypothetical protein